MSFDDFFHLESLNKEYETVNIITTEEFLRREGGQLHLLNTNDRATLPENRTNWDTVDVYPYWNYLESVGYIPANWDPNTCIATFPSTIGAKNNLHLIDAMDIIKFQKDGRLRPTHFEYQGNPVPVNAPMIERLREVSAGRFDLCIYNEEMQRAPVIHFSSNRIRLLAQFYSFVFFEDWRQATWANRLVRDHLRYNDEIMCAASRVIESLRQRSYSRFNSRGLYHSLHIRRNDFQGQFKSSEASIEDIITSLSNKIEQNSTIFVASDETNQRFFAPLKEKYHVYFLNDFENILEGINPNYNGMIEQLIAARGEVFFGTFFSTFSAYIFRLRGYYYSRADQTAPSDGKLPNSFYVSPREHNEYTMYKAVQQPFYSREFPVSWRDINRGIGEMAGWRGW